MRADGDNHQHVEVGLDDRPTAGERIGGGARCARDDQAIAAVAVHVAPVDAGFEVEDAAGVPFGEHHVVERELRARRQRRNLINLKYNHLCIFAKNNQENAEIALIQSKKTVFLLTSNLDIND